MSEATPLPAFQFQVNDNADHFKIKEALNKRNSLCAKICRVAWNIISAIILPIGIFRVIAYGLKCLSSRIIMPAPSLFTKEEKATFVKVCEEQVKIFNNDSKAYKCTVDQLTIRTADQVDLDCLSIQNTDQKEKPFNEQKWVVFLNGNGGCYEAYVNQLVDISKNTGASVFTGNYRGVGRSKGHPNSAHDMVIDAETTVQYLLQQGVLSENILVHGWSLGGVIASEVVSLHQEKGHEMHLVSDRSFADFRNVAKDWLSRPIGFVLGNIAAWSGWNLNAMKNFKNIQGRKIIIHHKDDGKISYQISLYKELKNADMTTLDRASKEARLANKKAAAKEGRVYTKVKDYSTAYKHAETIRLYSDRDKDLSERRWKLACHGNLLGKFPTYYQNYLNTVKSVLTLA